MIKTMGKPGTGRGTGELMRSDRSCSVTPGINASMPYIASARAIVIRG